MHIWTYLWCELRIFRSKLQLRRIKTETMNFNRSEPMTLRTGEVTSIEWINILNVFIWLSIRQNEDSKHVRCQAFQKTVWHQFSTIKTNVNKFVHINRTLYRKENENNHDHLAHVGSQKYYGKSSLVQWSSTQLFKFLRIAPNRDAFWNFFYPQCDPGREATLLSF